ncbi:amidohydrolase family protein [Tsuneonella sp. HG094]
MQQTRSATLALALLLSACVSPRVSAPPPSTQLAISSVRVIDTETAIASVPQDVLIADGRITAVAPAGRLKIPLNTPILDGSDHFALPGLIDVHAHIGEGGAMPNSEAGRERALRQFLRYGVTTVFVPGATGAGDAEWPVLTERCLSGGLVCPGLYGSGSLITARGSHPVSTIFNMPDDVPAAVTEARGVTVLDPGTDVSSLITAKKAVGATAIKIVIEDGPPPWHPKPRMSDAQIRAIVAAAHALSMPVFAHVSTSDQVRIALDADVDGIMHAPTDVLPASLVRRMADQGMRYVPTFSLYDGILTWARKQRESDPYALSGVHPDVIESLAAAPFLAAAAEDESGAMEYLANASENLRRVANAGVPIALGSDVNNPFVYPGYSAHEELSSMVRAGLTPAQALRSATIGSAKFLRASNRLGRIAPGFEADLLLLARNPLETIENSRSLVSVVADGRVISDVASTQD